ncbi:MAG: dihydroorotase [Clostridia bacterium]|nr:dihydroorotase [Clostridia bacterium]
MRWLLRGGRVLDPSLGFDGVADVLVCDGRVMAVGTDLPAEEARVVEADGLVVMPGLVDVRALLPLRAGARPDDLSRACRAAAAGGFTAVACRPDGDVVLDSAAAVAYLRERAAVESPVRVYAVGALSLGLAGKVLAPLGELAAEGVVAVGEGDRPVEDGAWMWRALAYATGFGLPVMAFCQDASLAGGGVAHLGPVAVRLGLAGVPAEAEVVRVVRDVLLARRTGARLHVGPVSAAETVRVLRWARSAGVRVTADVTAFHLVLDEDALAAGGGYDPACKLRPPLRGAADRQALVAAVAEGVVDCVSSGHVPVAPEEKELEFEAAAWGATGFETALAAAWTACVASGAMSPLALADRLSRRPARLLGVPGGSLAPGAPADLVLFDPATTWTVDPSAFVSRCRTTPLAGHRLRGRVLLTMVGGRVVHRCDCINIHEFV